MTSRRSSTAVAHVTRLAVTLAALSTACTEPNPVGPPCGPDTPCPAGQRCSTDSVCVPLASCAASSDCVAAGGAASTCCGARCVDTATDKSNCGGCGQTCLARPHATVACRGSDCVFDTCQTGWANCDGDALNGCEADLTSPRHCGTCEKVCDDGPDAIATCKAGACGLTCAGGRSDCDKNLANGCEAATASDPLNCGGCGMVCPGVPNGVPTCAGGVCGSGQCAPGMADCNRLAGDGCEASLSSPDHCGACDKVCPDLANGVRGCDDKGFCTLAACVMGFGDCDKNPGNGCEVKLVNDLAHCGACGAVCSGKNGTAVCDQGMCILGMCNAGFADCDKDVSNGCESMTASDPMNCGGCNVVCPAGPGVAAMCVAGKCSMGCAMGFVDCDMNPNNGCEADIKSPANCGRCGNVCKALPNAMPGCNLGQCGLGGCNPKWADCDRVVLNGCEKDVSSDLQNCGACGARCAAPINRTACVAGVCGITACGSGRADCDKVAANGCETRVLSDDRNCGGCGKVCPMGDVCNEGACTCAVCLKAYPHSAALCVNNQCAWAACNPGWSDCNNDILDGCEVDSGNDEANCGGCGVVCPMNLPYCQDGRCSVVPCDGSPFVQGVCWVKPSAQMVTHEVACKSIGRQPTDKLIDIQWDDRVLTEVARQWGWASIGDFNDSAHAMWCDVVKKQCGTHNFGSPFNNYGPWPEQNWWPVYTCIP